MPIFILFLFCFGLVSGVASAQPEETPALTVDEAVRLAVRTNPRLSAAVRDVAAARSGVRAARAQVNPELTVTPAITPGGSDEEVLFRQPLELGGTRTARTGVARAMMRQTEAQATIALRALVFDTRTAYYELVNARSQRALASDLQDAAAEIDRITRRQVEVGSRPGIDQTQTGIEVIRARQQVTLADSAAAAAQAALNTLMGRPAGEPIGLLAALPPAEAAMDEETAVRLALENRSEITVEEAAAEGFRQEAGLARAQGRPDLAPQFRAGSVTRGVSDTGIGIAITLPLFDYGSRRGRIAQAEESARAQEDRAAAVRAEVRREVAQALARLRAADAVIRDYDPELLQQARHLLEASRTGFQVGQTGIVALLDAQRTFRSVQTEYNNALVARAQARAELERATGTVPASLLSEIGIAPDRPSRVQEETLSR